MKGEFKVKHAVLGIILLLLVVMALPSMGVDLSKIQVFQATDAGDKVGQKTGQEAPEGPITEVTTPAGQAPQQIQVITIAGVNYKPSLSDALNETKEAIDPTFYLWEAGAVEPTSVAMSGGVPSTIPSVAPNQKITWSAGTDGTYYWEKGTTNIKFTNVLDDIKLYSVAGATDVTLKVYDKFTDISDGASNSSLAAGGSIVLTLTVDNTGEYTAVRSPYICVDYNSSNIRDVDIGGLLEETAIPTRLIAGLDQCFDTGIEYYMDSDTKLNYDATVKAITGQEPGVNVSKMYWYLIDKDLYWKNGKMYFMDPVDISNMGSTTEWTVWNTFS